MTSRDFASVGDTAVTAWFGDGFARLHPMLQDIHRDGGRLHGSVTLRFGRGLAGALGRWLARNVGIPDVAGEHRLDVEVSHGASAMSWNRCFDGTHRVHSKFRPEGHWPDGRWLETSGSAEFAMTVDVIDGGWHWRVVGMRLRGVRLPLWLLPRSAAGKRVEAGKYRFVVGFSLPILGEVLSYSGLLDLDTALP